VKIYYIINKINGKGYIGLTSKKGKEFEKYWGSGKLINRSIEKYGVENFEKFILANNIKSKKLLGELEIFYIKKLNTLAINENGYNLSPGGYGGNLGEEAQKKRLKSNQINPNGGFKNKHHSEESKNKIRINVSKALKGKCKSKEHCKKISINAKERYKNIKNHHMYGKKHSEETKKKISIAKKGSISPFKGCKHSEETKKKMSIAKTGIPMSTKIKQKISNTLKGKKLSIEHKRKLSEAAKNRIYYNICKNCNNKFKTNSCHTKFCNNCKLKDFKWKL